MSEETTLAQYKVACDRAWEVVKERDADVSALKRRIRQLEIQDATRTRAIKWYRATIIRAKNLDVIFVPAEFAPYL